MAFRLFGFCGFYEAFVALHFASFASTVPLCLGVAAFIGFMRLSAFPDGFWPWLSASSAPPLPLAPRLSI